MKLIFVFTLLLFLNINVKSQEAKPQEQAAADTNQKWTRVGVDSLLENIRNYFDELLDVEVGWAALQARHISNVGYGIDNSIGLNRELRDTLEFLRNVVQSELFVKSMLKYDHFWPNLINRRKYSPTIRELENQHEDVYKKNLFFDVVFYPAWDTTKMDVDAARKSGKIEYTCEIKVNGLGSFKTELSEKEMSRVLNEALTSKEYKRIKGEAAPDVNQGLFAGMGWLIDKFGFKPFDDPVNIKRVDFYAPTAQSYGYDKYEDAVLAGNYDNISVKGKQYYVPWKSAAVTKTDTLIAVAVKKNPDRTSGDTLKFITTNGQPVKSVLQINDTTYKITLPPITSEGEFGLVATYSYVDTTGKDIVVNAGQANISGYTTQPMKLVIVPVNGNGKELSVTDIQQTINDIYKQAATTWSVEMYKGNLQVQNVYADDNKLDDGKTGFFSNYTDEMNDVIDAFKDQPDVDIDKKTCYLFMVNNAKSGSGKCGFMPLKRQFGFIFTDNCTDETGRTIAHELGHGPFRLYHTFSDENEYTRGEATTDNLMDYNNGSGLNKYQWDLIHDPESMIAWLQDDEEGAAQSPFKYFSLLMTDNGLKMAYLSKKGKTLFCTQGEAAVQEHSRFVNAKDEFLIGKEYQLQIVRQNCYTRNFPKKFYKADIYINNNKINRIFARDFSISSYTQYFVKRKNQVRIVMFYRRPNTDTWNEVDEMEFKIVYKEPVYHIKFKRKKTKKELDEDKEKSEKFKEEFQVYKENEIYRVKRNMFTEISLFDKEKEKPLISIKSAEWEITEAGKTRKVSAQNTIQVKANGVDRITVKVTFMHKGETENLTFYVEAQEEIPNEAVPIAYSVEGNNSMAYTKSWKSSVAVVRRGSAEVKFKRYSSSDDFTTLNAFVTNENKLEVEVLEQTKSDITLQITSLTDDYDLDSSYVYFADVYGRKRIVQKVYILKLLELQPTFMFCTSLNNRPDYSTTANATFMNYIGGVMRTRGREALSFMADRNRNGKIEHIFGDPENDEYHELENIPVDGNLKVIFVPGGIVEYTKIKSIRSITDVRDGVELEAMNCINKINNAIFKCDVLNASFEELYTGIDAIKTGDGLEFYQLIRDEAVYVRATSNNTAAGLKIRNDLVIVGVVGNKTAETLVHELLHTRGLVDINVPGNMMHWTATPIAKPYFSNEPVKECQTGSGEPKEDGVIQRQWFDIER